VGRFAGLLVGSAFGLAFVLANAHAPVPATAGLALAATSVPVVSGVASGFVLLSGSLGTLLLER
jgi:hypothetical protein